MLCLVFLGNPFYEFINYRWNLSPLKWRSPSERQEPSLLPTAWIQLEAGLDRRWGFSSGRDEMVEVCGMVAHFASPFKRGYVFCVVSSPLRTPEWTPDHLLLGLPSVQVQVQVIMDPPTGRSWWGPQPDPTLPGVQHRTGGVNADTAYAHSNSATVRTRV